VNLWRLRVVFARTGDLRFISHLDLVTLWQRVLRRARVPVAYSQGFNPQPRLAFAAALPVGHVGRQEIFDVWLVEPWSPEAFAKAGVPQLPVGIDLVGVEEVPLRESSLQSRVVSARYLVSVPWQGEGDEVARRVGDLLARSSVPWRRVRRRREEEFDLRPLLLDMRVEGVSGGECMLWMHLRAGQRGSLRPEDVVRVLDLPEPYLIERLGLELVEERLSQDAHSL